MSFEAIVLNLNRERKDPKKVRWGYTLLAALVLLYVGIDSMFFDSIAGSGPLTWIDRTHAILLDTLLVTISISLVVVAWTGRPIGALNTNSTTVGKLFAYAYCAAVGAFVFGLFLVRTIMHFDSRYLAGFQRDCKEACRSIPVVLYFLQHAFVEFWFHSVGTHLVFPRLRADI
jgi:hypothetical protein